MGEMIDARKIKTHPDYRAADTYRLKILGQDYVDQKFEDTPICTSPDLC